MRHYNLQLSNQAERVLRRMAEREASLYQRIVLVLDALQVDPFQGKALKGQLQGRYSYRVGVYRVIYRVYKQQLLVVVIDIGHRRGVYR